MWAQNSAGGMGGSGKTSGKMGSFHKVLQVGVTVMEGKSVTQSRTVYRLEEHPYSGVWGGRGRT